MTTLLIPHCVHFFSRKNFFKPSFFNLFFISTLKWQVLIVAQYLAIIL
jgi:hypothetical protein